MTTRVDAVVVGGGILGLATARALQRRSPAYSVALLEKESSVAEHQSGRNSGVVHAGVYYAPGSLKARFCRAGNAAVAAYCLEHGLPFDRCGKLIVATDEAELGRLADLTQRCRDNGLDVRRIDADELGDLEPNVAGIAALHVADSGIVDYGALCRHLADSFEAAGGELRLGVEVTALREHARGVDLTSASGEMLEGRRAVICAGIHADRFVRMLGREPGFFMLPVRGDYYLLEERYPDFIRHLIYPVPDPALPYLGVHLTPTVHGRITVGPNAALALGREAYAKHAVEWRHLAALAARPEARRLLWRQRRGVVSEWRSSLSRRVYLDRARRYCPGLALESPVPLPAGIRAQAVTREGALIEDFLFEKTERCLIVCNAPSPAATSSFPIAEHVVARLE